VHEVLVAFLMIVPECVTKFVNPFLMLVLLFLRIALKLVVEQEAQLNLALIESLEVGIE